MADSNGNIVQYTDANIGAICLAVNFHAKIMDAIHRIEQITTDERIVSILREATERYGLKPIIDELMAAEASSGEFDKKIAAELQMPIANYTSSLELAMGLIPPTWTAAFKPVEGGMLVELTNGSMTTSSNHREFPMAICIAALQARDTASVAAPAPVGGVESYAPPFDPPTEMVQRVPPGEIKVTYGP